MSHAIQVRQAGGPKALNWTPIEVGEPGPWQIRLRQAVAGLNYVDLSPHGDRSGRAPARGPR